MNRITKKLVDDFPFLLEIEDGNLYFLNRDINNSPLYANLYRSDVYTDEYSIISPFKRLKINIQYKINKFNMEVSEISGVLNVPEKLHLSDEFCIKLFDSGINIISSDLCGNSKLYDIVMIKRRDMLKSIIS